MEKHWGQQSARSVYLLLSATHMHSPQSLHQGRIKLLTWFFSTGTKRPVCPLSSLLGTVSWCLGIGTLGIQDDS